MVANDAEALIRKSEKFDEHYDVLHELGSAAGGDLHRHCIEGDVTRTEKEICYLIRQITEAVRYLHDQSIVHLDLKPDNILLAKECEIFPEIRLIDFGLSRRLNVPYSQFDIVGTPEYVAPEVLAYEPIDYGSDMWSIGVVTYVLLSGISPFAGDDVMETYANIGMVDYDFDCEEFDEISETAIDFIEKLLVRSPKKRMTAREALEHDWLKQLEGGITAADVAYATHAQKEPLPDTEVSTPLVEEDYPSSSESETPLEKSLERLDDAKAIEDKEAVGNDKNFIEPERKISNDSVLADSALTEEETAKAEPSQEEPKQLIEEPKPLSENNESEPTKEAAICPPEVNENSSKKDDVEYKKVDESLKTDKSVDIKPEPVVPQVEDIAKNNKSGQEKTSGSIAVEVNNSKDEKLEPKKTSVSKSGTKDGHLIKNEGKSNIAKKAAFLKSKSSEEVPKPNTSTAKRGSTDSGMPSKPSAIEQRKLALQLKMNDDPLKSIKPGRNEIKKSQSTTPNSERSKFSSTPSSGSNRSSANSSPGEIRKSANISPVPRRTESPVLGTQKKISNTSPLPARKSDVTARFTSDKQKTDLKEQSPRISRNSLRGKIPGGIAAKMANKFDSSPGRSSPQHNQKIERKANLKDERIARTKPDIKPDEPVPKKDAKGSTTNKKAVESVMQNESTQKGAGAVTSTNESKGPLSNNSSKLNNPLEMPEKQNQDIKFSLALGGSVSPSGKKLTIGPLVSLAEKKGDDNVQKKEVNLEKVEEAREGRKELDGRQPIRMKMGSGAPIKLGIGRPQRKSSDDSIKMDESSKGAPMLKETRGKNQSLSRRRAGTNDSSPSSSRKNYRRLYVTKVRNSRVFDADLQIDTAAAAEIMQRVDNDVLKVEFRLKSTDLKLLPA